VQQAPWNDGVAPAEPPKGAETYLTDLKKWIESGDDSVLEPVLPEDIEESKVEVEKPKKEKSIVEKAKIVSPVSAPKRIKVKALTEDADEKPGVAAAAAAAVAAADVAAPAVKVDGCTCMTSRLTRVSRAEGGRCTRRRNGGRARHCPQTCGCCCCRCRCASRSASVSPC
jgi:hypothetical protein